MDQLDRNWLRQYDHVHYATKDGTSGEFGLTIPSDSDLEKYKTTTDYLIFYVLADLNRDSEKYTKDDIKSLRVAG